VFREEIVALEETISVLRHERDSALQAAHDVTALDLRGCFDKWEKKKFMSVATASVFQLPSFEERQLVSAGSSDVGGMVGSSHGVTRVGGRRLASCDTFQFAGDLVALNSSSDGWNLLRVNCALGAHIVVSGGKTMKIKKDSSVMGVVVLDRQATSENKGRHFSLPFMAHR
jgi:hypothetical protein